MSTKTIDRRVSRTRTMLQHAFRTLLRKKRYESITIHDICAAANVGRSTFYSHFRSKDDLKRSGVQEGLRSALTQRHSVARSNVAHPLEMSWDFSLSVFEHARDHADHYRTLAGGRGGAIALSKVRQMVTGLVRDELASTGARRPPEAIPREVVVQYIVGAYMALLTWWLDGGAKLPPERIDAMFRTLTTRGVAG